MLGIVFVLVALSLSSFQAFAQQPIELADFGDAPDSVSNHVGIDNTAYPGVRGLFPSVWEGTPAGEGSGPRHANPHVVWLGDNVTDETDADILPDSDGITNILDGGADNANNDRADDGWLNASYTLFPDCRGTMLKIRVSKTPGAQTGRMYLNVWFDGDRNGQWGERKQCPSDPNSDLVTFAHEWIVQNFVVDTSAIVGHQDILVPTFILMNNAPQKPAWVRITLSEEPAPQKEPFVSDGRGPDYPQSYALGETEDYFYKPPVEGQPGQVEIKKSTSVQPADEPLSVGDVFTYSVNLRHNGGTAPAQAVMTDVLPAQVKLVRGPFVTEVTPHVGPLSAAFFSGIGPSGAVAWAGYLSPNAEMRVDFVVKVRNCPPLDNNIRRIHNVAEMYQNGGGHAQDFADVAVDCPAPPPPHITLHKEIERDPADTDLTADAEHPILPGHHAVYVLTLDSSDPISHSVRVTDTLPAELVAVNVSADSGDIRIENSGSSIVWNAQLGPDNRPLHAKIMVKPTERLRCEDRIVNVAHWIVRWGTDAAVVGRSNPVTVYLACRDFGDAPDSTNHFGVPMDAYPGVEAHFPTVYAVSPPERGPVHLITKPFHLGRAVSEERGADVGLDMDGINNIEPKANKANLDKHDDGLVRPELSFQNCQQARVPVFVTIDPTMAAALPPDAKGIGYLNVWLDSNRDGDWADAFDCPVQPGDTPVANAQEHIVVDWPVDVVALGPGIHKIYATTSVPVWWPKDMADQPVWLRITLSERPSNKTIKCDTSGSNCQFGDGRGYDLPFRFGETEDYLLRVSDHDTPPPADGADPRIFKRGSLTVRHEPTTDKTYWLAEWRIEYENNGAAAATDVQIKDTLDGSQTLRGETSVPPLPAAISGNTVEYTIPSLGPGSVGFIGIRSEIPFDAIPGTVLTNTASITATNDGDATNNTAVVTVTVPLLPPRITYPTPGTTCTGTFTITGRAQPNVDIDLYIDGALETTVSADSAGQWSYAVTLADGAHDIYAVAKYGSMTSDPSATVEVIVDSSLTWNPLSLRFEDDAGHVTRPRDASGRTDETGWRIFLRRGTTYTATVETCCTDPNAVVELELDGVGSITLTDPDGDLTYSATFTTPSTGPVIGTVRLCVTCELIKQCSDGELTIDPEGTVFDLSTGQPVDAASVACMEAQASASETGESGIFTLWTAEDYGQVNPQSTGSDGYFSFFTPPGTYRLEVSKPGYQSYRSPELLVVDQPVHFDVPLTPEINDAADFTISVDNTGFDPAILTVQPGSIIEWVNIDDNVHSATSVTPTVSCDACAAALGSSDGWDSGLLNNGEVYKRQLNTVGTYTYRDESNPTATATIIVENPSHVIYLPTVAR
jgi:uncharacterized repeat protein (TIGR01451 family)